MVTSELQGTIDVARPVIVPQRCQLSARKLLSSRDIRVILSYHLKVLSEGSLFFCRPFTSLN
jgi:hypothetical protein